MHLRKNWLPIIGLAILALAVLSLLVSTVIEAWVYHYLGGAVAFLVLVGAGSAIFQEAKKLGHSPLEKEGDTFWLPQGLSVILGGLAAYALAHELGLGPVIAASLIGLLASLIWPETSVAAYCGAFVGMTSDILFFNYWEVTLAGLIAGGVYLLTKDIFNGFGGKLGTIALVGTALTGLSLNREFFILPVADLEANILVLATAMLATPFTFYFNIARKHGPVMASAIVGMMGGLILPALMPQFGPTLAVVAICASFAGMTSKERCPNFWQILVTGFFTGVVFIYSTPLLGGAGGKLGTIAFGAVLGTCGLKRLLGWIIHPRNKGISDQGS